MKKAITVDEILRVEHELIGEALVNVGVEPLDFKSAYDYIFGAYDMVNEIIKKMERSDDE